MKAIDILEEALKQAMAYGWNKGYANDIMPNHEEANSFRDKALQTLQTSLLEQLPKKYGGTVFNLPADQQGWNIAIDDMTNSINDYFREEA